MPGRTTPCRTIPGRTTPVQDGAGAEAAGEQVARQGALAFTGSNSVLPLLGGVLLVAGLLAAGLAAWARRNRSHSAGNRA